MKRCLVYLIIILLSVPSVCLGWGAGDGRGFVGAAAGAGGTEFLYPSADGFGSAWDAQGGCTPDYNCVGGTTSTFSDIEYLDTSSDFAGSYVELDDTAEASGKIITSVTVYWRAKGSVESNGVRFKLRINGADFDGPRPTQTTGFLYYSQEFLLNPEDSQAWTSADIDTLQLSMLSLTISSATYSVSHCYAEVIYE